MKYPSMLLVAGSWLITTAITTTAWGEGQMTATATEPIIIDYVRGYSQYCNPSDFTARILDSDCVKRRYKDILLTVTIDRMRRYQLGAPRNCKAGNLFVTSNHHDHDTFKQQAWPDHGFGAGQAFATHAVRCESGGHQLQVWLRDTGMNDTFMYEVFEPLRAKSLCQEGRYRGSVPLNVNLPDNKPRIDVIGVAPDDFDPTPLLVTAELSIPVLIYCH